MNPVKYENEDLDYIYIRVQNKLGKWVYISLRKANNMQFRTWLFKRFEISVKRIDDDNLEITSKFNIKNPAITEKLLPVDKIAILNWLNDQGAKIYMIKREARDNF